MSRCGSTDKLHLVWFLPAVGLALFSGCAQSQPQKNLSPSPPPAVLPIGGTERAEAWYYQWVTQADSPSETVTDMLFILGGRGRDWRGPAGPDGYAVRVILLGANGQPVTAEGNFQAFLVASPDKSNARAVCAWSLAAEQTERRLRHDRLSGYLLQLDWGQSPVASDDTFMLVIRWASLDGYSRFTRNVVFEEVLTRELITTTRPATDAGSADPDSGSDDAPSGSVAD